MRSKIFMPVCLILVAGVLRFYKLGEWPFARDELATLAEEASLFRDGRALPSSPIYRLPRIIPLGYLVLHAGYPLFGRDEFGSRAIVAILGSASVGAIYQSLNMLRGRAVAIATSLLIVLWPYHIVQSQENRFYMMAFFFSSLCLLVGALAAQRKSTTLSVMASCLALAAGLCHTICFVALFLMNLAMLAGWLAERRPPPGRLLLVFCLASLLVIGYVAFYLRPLVRGWNEGAQWGYNFRHSILASLSMLGWPIVLLCCLGFALLLRERSVQGWYWVACALGWAVMIIVLPFLVIYQPAYGFPLALAPMVLAGSAIATLYGCLRRESPLIGLLWLVLAGLMNLPGVASHYVDGSRPDMRTAAKYVKENWVAGDLVTGPSMGLFRRYFGPGHEHFIPLSMSDPIPQLQKLSAESERLWIVVGSGRSGLPENLRNWLGRRCSHELRLRRRRFDEADFCIDVFLYDN